MESVQADLQSATVLVQQASSALQSATVNVSSAAAQLASAQSMPDIITDASGKEVDNPDKASAVAQAQSAYEQALQAQAQALADLAEAQEEVQATQEVYIQLQTDLQDEKAVLEANKAEAEANKQEIDTQKQELLDTISNFDSQLTELNAQLEIAQAEQATAEQNQKEEGFTDENGNLINVEKTGYQKDKSAIGEDNKLVINEDNAISIINENLISTAGVTTAQQYNDYAEQIYNATAGRLGTDENSFYEVLNNEDLTGDAWVNIIQSYENNYGTSLINDVCADFSGITEKKTCNEIMDKISSKLLESIENGNKNAINITCNELYSSLNSDYLRAGAFAKNILNNSSNEAITQISKNYNLTTDSDLISDVNNNSNISTADSDLITQRLNSIVTNEISATEELNLDDYGAEDKNKAWTINLLTQSLNSSINEFQNQNNEDGDVSGGFNAIKTLTGLGVSSQDIVTSLDEQESLINELTKALNGESDKYSSFEEAYKDLTGVEYNEDKIIEYQQNATNYSIACNTVQNAQNFQDSISNADNLQDVYDLYVNYYGDEEKGKEEFLSYIQGGMIPNEDDYDDISEKVAQFGGYVTSVEFNDDGQLVIQKATNYENIREGEEYEYETVAYDLADTANMIKTMPRTFDDTKYVNQALDKIQKSFGSSLEELQETYANSKQTALGNSDKLEETINRYCQSQDGFIDKLTSTTQIIGMGAMAVGGVVSFVNPPIGAGIMETGKYMALGGMFGNQALEAIDGITSENGLSKEEIAGLLKETASELGFMALGSGINSVAEAAQVGSLEALQAAGLSKNSATVLSWLAEGGTDMSLSVLSDLVITGDFNLENNGTQVLLGILTGVANAKVNSYKANAKYKLDFDIDKITEIDPSSTRSLKTGELFIDSSNKNLSIKTADGSIETLNISREKFKELFPTGMDVKVKQGNVGDCFLVSSIYSLLSNPKSRAKVLKCFSENADGSVTCKLPDSKVEFTLQAGQKISSVFNATKFSSGSLGVQMLEHIYGLKLVQDEIEPIEKSISMKNNRLDRQNIMLDFYNKIQSGEVTDIDTLKSLMDEIPIEDGVRIGDFYEQFREGYYSRFLTDDYSAIDFDKVSSQIDACNKTISETMQGLENANSELLKLNKNKAKREIKLRNKGGEVVNVYKAFGFESAELKCSSDTTSASQIIEDLIKDCDDYDDYVISGSTVVKTTITGFLNIKLDMVGNHAYTIQPYKNSAGEIEYKVTNPWHTRKYTTLSAKELNKYFPYIYCVKVK